MKKLFSVLMVAVVATLAFAFTTPKAFDDVTYHLEGGVWVENEGDGCASTGNPCDITFDIAYASFANQIGAQAPAAPSTVLSYTANIDTNGDSVPDTQVPVQLTRKQ